MAEKIKVLIVDDATFMVKALCEILESDPDIEVVDSAKNGNEALDKIKQFHPDVVTLDVDMPVMDGIKTIRHIMIESPVPIVMLSSLFSHGDITFEALRLGVVDFLPKPSGAISRDIHDQRHHIVERVKIAASERIENVRRVKLNRQDLRDHLEERYGFQMLDYLITIGTTLGGPNTIIRLMSQLSAALPAAIVAVQEITPSILPEYAKQFNMYTPWRVEVGEENMVLEQGVCYLCSYQEPFMVQTNQNQEPCLKAISDSGKPLDVLFASAAEVFEQNTIGVLLTGVGDDGKEGFGYIKKKSGNTIAQNTNTCVYPNLTQGVIEQGLVDIVTGDSKLCEKIEALVSSKAQDSQDMITSY